MTAFDESRLHELEALTRDYARYSRSAGGLASVLGGLCCIASYLAGGLLPTSPALRIALVALPLAWLLAKQLLARRYYQRFGHVEEQETAAVRRTHVFCVGVVLLMAVLVTIGTRSWPLGAGKLGYLALLWLLVPAGWFWLRSPLEFFVGTFLFCQAAVSCAGFAYPVVGTAEAAANPPMALLALLFPLAALLFVGIGVADHRRFLALRERLAHLRDAGDDA